MDPYTVELFHFALVDADQLSRYNNIYDIFSSIMEEFAIYEAF